MPSQLSQIRRLISSLPRTSLISLPTPLNRVDRMSAELGLDLWIKRDDLTGIGCGGNKLRKLEFIVAQARENGIDTLLTTGGAQSNHARLTAAVAARLGMSCELYLNAEPISAREGNLLLDTLFGAAIHFCGITDYSVINDRMASRVEELERAGHKALAVPLGGATGPGTLGYVVAFAELHEQLAAMGRNGPLTVVVSGGTGSTAAGLLVGAALLAPQTRLLVVSASWDEDKLKHAIRSCALEASQVLGVAAPAADRLIVSDRHVGPGYAQTSEEGIAAVLRVARSEGILLDTTYTGKAMSGLIASAECGTLNSDGPTVFLHTGGTPDVFTRRWPVR
ncbi:1-aminocyclopropane-1-carboxylate deaminase/D-cysteine desulfhydrase [Mesorhizobium marinum]|uniref:1-aminocyclopropane-1-carboxylate deaminase/D-cysteine desulfhydrase n=1 Tax=Mesorhizobium marinum TaxID=3228790 RepID=UPI0034660AA6